MLHLQCVMIQQEITLVLTNIEQNIKFESLYDEKELSDILDMIYIEIWLLVVNI